MEGGGGGGLPKDLKEKPGLNKVKRTPTSMTVRPRLTVLMAVQCSTLAPQYRLDSG